MHSVLDNLGCQFLGLPDGWRDMGSGCVSEDISVRHQHEYHALSGGLPSPVWDPVCSGQKKRAEERRPCCLWVSCDISSCPQTLVLLVLGPSDLGLDLDHQFGFLGLQNRSEFYHQLPWACGLQAADGRTSCLLGQFLTTGLHIDGHYGPPTRSSLERQGSVSPAITWLLGGT
jgi:hypothetical protein